MGILARPPAWLSKVQATNTYDTPTSNMKQTSTKLNNAPRMLSVEARRRVTEEKEKLIAVADERELRSESALEERRHRLRQRVRSLFTKTVEGPS